jgi:uncharacterized membrane protein YfcA
MNASLSAEYAVPDLTVLPAVVFEPAFYVIMIPAVIILGLAKGGFAGLGLLGVPMLSLVMSPVQAAAILMPILIIQDVVSVWAYRKTFDRRNIMIMLPGAAIGITIGYLLARSVPEHVVRLMVGVVAVGFVGFYWRRRHGALNDRPRGGVISGLFWGGLAGYTSFVAHAGAPPFQVYVMPQRLPPQTYAGTTTVFFAVTNALKALPYFALGQFSAENLTTSAALVPVAILSTFFGVWLVRRVNAARFYDIIYGLTFLLGLNLIREAVAELVF